MSRRFALAALVACGAAPSVAATDAPDASVPSPPVQVHEAGAPEALPEPCDDGPCAPPEDAAPAAPGPLHVRFLGVAGFLLEYGGESVMTAPLFTHPSMFQVSTGLPVTSDGSLVDKALSPASLAKVRAIVTGHAHYDHLLDVPEVMKRAPQATLYANVSAKNLLAAYAPDRADSCGGTPPFTIPRASVVAMDDPSASVVDYTNCPEKRPPGAPLEGKWVTVPGAHVRVLAVCSSHPDQIGPIHFAPGDVTEEACTPPTQMDAWKEGFTMALLVDFLDPKTERPVYRVYYQDAPTNAPVGHVPPPLLADKAVDLALLCVGSSDQVENAPTATIDALTPRFALGGHWEDFFQSADQPPQPLPLLDVNAWQTKAQTAMPQNADGWTRNGAPLTDRALLPQPNDEFELRAK